MNQNQPVWVNQECQQPVGRCDDRHQRVQLSDRVLRVRSLMIGWRNAEWHQLHLRNQATHKRRTGRLLPFQLRIRLTARQHL
jgi:hypothetical protein